MVELGWGVAPAHLGCLVVDTLFGYLEYQRDSGTAWINLKISQYEGFERHYLTFATHKKTFTQIFAHELMRLFCQYGAGYRFVRWHFAYTPPGMDPNVLLETTFGNIMALPADGEVWVTMVIEEENS